MRVGSTLLGAALLAGCNSPAESLRQTQLQVAKDAEEQYNIVERTGGSAADKCMRAKLVAEGYLQARDERQYDVWKTRERADCAIAGLEATR